MLKLKPTCENCNTSLPPNSTDAMICSFECTFCRECVENVLDDVCPNCGGGFCPRPIRPGKNLKDDNFLGKYPASSAVVYRPVDMTEHETFSSPIKGIRPESR